MSLFKKIFGKKNEPEFSESGAPVYRHESRSEQFVPAGGDDHTEEISEHIERHIGHVDGVFHELISEHVHLDIHIVKATEDRPFHVLVTSGMSNKAMNVPADLTEFAHAELCLLLPEDWSLEHKDWDDENVYWPIRWLKTIARLPHEYNTWIGYGHTIPNGEDAAPFAPGTRLGCILVMPPLSLPEEFEQLQTADGKTIHFYTIAPLYPEEMLFKMKHGVDALTELFDEWGIDDVLDPERPNVLKDQE